MANPVLRHTLIGVPTLLVGGFASIPVAAALFDDRSRFPDNLPVYAAIGISAALGAATTAALPGMAGRGASRMRGAALGTIYGPVAMTASMVGWALLLG